MSAPQRGWRRRWRAKREPRRETLGESVRTLATAVVLALAIRTLLLQTFYVPSGSMLETLLIGDHVFVNKVLYGVRIPWTDWRLPGIREPARGDVVVFEAARARDGRRVIAADRRPELRREDFIKRIVAGPGDLVEVRQGILYVNGDRVTGGPVGRRFENPEGRALDVLDETVPRCSYHVLDDPVRGPIDLAPVRVEEGRYLMMGDNRDDSHDGRFFGTVRLQEILGSAGLIYWSWDWNGPWGPGCLMPFDAACLGDSLLNPLTWSRNLIERTRWRRLGDSVSC
ncbi:MAG: signal peptidase I [Myxococcota bacterium]